MLLAAAALAGCAGPPKPGGSPVTDLAGRCSQVEEDGYREDARLDIRDGVVEQLVWHVQAGKRGGCRFHLDQFRQVKRLPHIELEARDTSKCRLMIYSDRNKVTLGHVDCARQCTAGMTADTWPVMFDLKTGGCAPLGR